MSRLSTVRDVITGQRRRADREQAERITRAMREAHAARLAHPGERTTEVARAETVQARAHGIATSRARALALDAYDADFAPPSSRKRPARAARSTR